MGGSGDVTTVQWDMEAPVLLIDPNMSDMLPVLLNMLLTGRIGWQDLDKATWEPFGDQ